MNEFGTMPFESRDGVQGELIIGVDLLGGAGHDHGGDGFVAFEKIFHDLLRDCHEVRFEVFGVLDKERGIDDGGQRSVRQIAPGLV